MPAERLFFGRRIGKGSSKSTSAVIGAGIDDFMLDMGELPCIHNQYRQNILEIGFGNGLHLMAMAASDPDSLFVGVEGYQTGVSNCIRTARLHGLKNIRIAPFDVGLIIDKLPNQCFDKIFILFPDPWPKQRHHKRRLINKHFLQCIVKSIKPNGTFIIATDDQNYQNAIKHAFAEGLPDWHLLPSQPELITISAYHQKAINAGREAWVAEYRRAKDR